MIYIKVIKKPLVFYPDVNCVFGSWPALFGRGHWKSMQKHVKSCSGKNSCNVELFKRVLREHEVTAEQKVSSAVVTAT